MGQGPMGMMADRQQVMAEMEARQKRLDDLVARMPAATGQARIDLMVAAITELVAQHKAVQRTMISMQGGMMRQMMRNMQSAPSAAPPPAPPSPDDKAPAQHEEHHP